MTTILPILALFCGLYLGWWALLLLCMVIAGTSEP